MRRDAVSDTVQLRLLGRFTMTVDGCQLALSRTSQRLLARVALNDGVEDRAKLARTLWPEHPSPGAQANLRSAVWRLPSDLHRHLVLNASTPGVRRPLGHRPAGSRAARRRRTRTDHRDAGRHPFPARPVARLGRALAAGAPRALPAAASARPGRPCRAPPSADQPFRAIDCALLAISSEPLRESAQRLLVRGHLAAGNRAAAWSCYEQFRRLLANELGVPPGPDFTALVAGLGHARR